jgi:hypothetical protein
MRWPRDQCRVPNVTEISAPRLDPVVSEAPTDSSHAQRFAEDYGGQPRFNRRRGIRVRYATPLLRPDDDGQVYRLALEYVRGRQQRALTMQTMAGTITACDS